MYRFEIDYDLKDYEVLSRLDGKVMRKTLIRVSRGFLALYALNCLLCGAYCMIWREEWFNGVCGVIIGLLFVGVTIFLHSILARWTRWKTPRNIYPMLVALGEDCIYTQHQKGSDFTPYDAIERAFYFLGYYYLMLDNRRGIFLPEKMLIEGENATLKAFLEEKLQKEVMEIR